MEELIIRIEKLVIEKLFEKECSTQELAEELSVSAELINTIKNRKTDILNLTLM